MKKFLAVLLALCMIMGSIVIVSAEETAAEHPTESNKIRVDVEGFGGGEYAATPEGGSLVKTIGAGKHGVGDPQFSWNGKKNDNFDAVSYDISAMESMVVEMYVSHPEYFNGKTFEMEIGSDGGPDGEENAYVDNFSQYAEGGELKEGWNTVTIPMSKWAAGSADLTRMNDLRWFNRADQTGDIEIPDGVIVQWNIGSIKFVGGGQTIEIPKNTKENPGNWGGVSYTDYAGTRTYTMTDGQDVSGGKGFVAGYALPEAIDLSTYKYVDIYAYVEGAKALRNVKFEFELSSSGTCDKQESNYTGYLNNIGDGWTTIRIPLSAFTLGDGADFSAINWMRLYTNAGKIQGSDAKIQIAYFQFSDSAATRYEEYHIPVGNEATLPSNVKLVSTASDNKTDCMFADVGNEIVYQVTLEYIKPSFVYLVAPLGGAQAKVQVSIKNNADDYVTIFDEETHIPGTGLQTINIGSYISTGKFASGAYKLFIRVADYNTADGNGGQIRYKEGGKAAPFFVAVGYSDWEQDPDELIITDEMIAADEAEMMATEHSVPLFGCNAAIGGFTVDYSDAKGGASCLTYKLGTWTEIDKTTGEEVEKSATGQAGFTFKTIDYAGEDFVDATGMDTLEFWFYVSDKDALAAASFQDNCFELTSSGTYDREEWGWRLDSILAQCTQNGWNEIRLPFSAASGDADPSRLNFVRWYFVNSQNLPAEPVIIKIDNIRLTDYEAQQIAKETPAAEAMAAKISEKLGNIPEWDEENADVVAQYDANATAWRADYEALKAELDAMSDIAQGIVSDLGAKKLVTNLKRWLDRYDKYEPAPVETPTETPTETPEENPEENPEETPTETPDDPTEEPTEEPKEGGNTVVIIIIVAVVVVVGAVVAFIVIKKKKA